MLHYFSDAPGKPDAQPPMQAPAHRQGEGALAGEHVCGVILFGPNGLRLHPGGGGTRLPQRSSGGSGLAGARASLGAGGGGARAWSCVTTCRARRTANSASATGRSSWSS